MYANLSLFFCTFSIQIFRIFINFLCTITIPLIVSIQVTEKSLPTHVYVVSYTVENDSIWQIPVWWYRLATDVHFWGGGTWNIFGDDSFYEKNVKKAIKINDFWLPFLFVCDGLVSGKWATHIWWHTVSRGRDKDKEVGLTRWKRSKRIINHIISGLNVNNTLKFPCKFCTCVYER